VKHMERLYEFEWVEHGKTRTMKRLLDHAEAAKIMQKLCTTATVTAARMGWENVVRGPGNFHATYVGEQAV
jgi:hypothetical protein